MSAALFQTLRESRLRAHTRVAYAGVAEGELKAAPGTLNIRDPAARRSRRCASSPRPTKFGNSCFWPPSDCPDIGQSLLGKYVHRLFASPRNYQSCCPNRVSANLSTGARTELWQLIYSRANQALVWFPLPDTRCGKIQKDQKRHGCLRSCDED